MSRKPRDLTQKQQAFVREYLVDLNATQAAIRAGYSANTAAVIGHENLRKPQISIAVESALAAREQRTEITQDYVLTGIRETVERCRQTVPVFDALGNETGEYTFQAAAALKGYEMLGKHLKLFTEKVEVFGKVTLEELLVESLAAVASKQSEAVH